MTTIVPTNSVNLIGHYGGDKTHALSAWTSTSRDLDDEKLERIPALLKFLAENGHHTPFEKSFLHFVVRCDTATHIHFLKHRIGVSINGESPRYKQLKEPTCYGPDDWSKYDRWLGDAYYNHVQQAYAHYEMALDRLIRGGMDRKRAKESARFFLPYGNQLTLDVSFNGRSFLWFLGLRLADDAQLEVREIAQKMLSEVRSLPGEPFKYTLTAFGYE